MEKIKEICKKIKQALALVVYQFQDPYYQGSAPQLAFFMFLSVMPTIVLVSQILGFFNLSIEDIQEWANISITGEGLDAMTDMLKYNPRGATNIFLIILAVWAASRMNFGLLRITNYTFTDGEFATRGWLPDRLKSVVSMLIILSTLLLTIIVLVYLPAILKLIFSIKGDVPFFDSVWLSLRWPIVAALYFFAISYVYFVMPNKRVHYRNILPGTAFAAVGSLLITLLYNMYSKANMWNNFLYGSISSIIVLIFWFWLISWVLTIGIVLNRVVWYMRSDCPMEFSKEFLNRRVPYGAKGMKRFVQKNVDMDVK